LLFACYSIPSGCQASLDIAAAEFAVDASLPAEATQGEGGARDVPL